MASFGRPDGLDASWGSRSDGYDRRGLAQAF